MLLGKVVGNVVSTKKVHGLVGYKLLLVKPLYEDDGGVVVAVDKLGAGQGETVIVTTGPSVSFAYDEDIPADAIVIGIVDEEPNLPNYS